MPATLENQSNFLLEEGFTAQNRTRNFFSYSSNLYIWETDVSPIPAIGNGSCEVRFCARPVVMWISPDPARQFASLYSYAGNGYNPINGVDPDGRRLHFYSRPVFGSENIGSHMFVGIEDWETGQTTYFSLTGSTDFSGKTGIEMGRLGDKVNPNSALAKDLAYIKNGTARHILSSQMGTKEADRERDLNFFNALSESYGSQKNQYPNPISQIFTRIFGIDIGQNSNTVIDRAASKVGIDLPEGKNTVNQKNHEE